VASKNRYEELHEVRIYVSELLLFVFAEAVILSNVITNNPEDIVKYVSCCPYRVGKIG
jgi:hypothetical protein